MNRLDLDRTKANKRLYFLTFATLVLLAAAFLRLFLLQDVPPGLSRDEALNADIVSFIWQGKHALFFREGYGHEPLYHYWAALFRPLLGDNYLAIRLPSVYAGLVLVALTMRWARREFGPLTALLTGALLAISWWPIVFSRIGLRPILEPVLLVAAAWFWPRRPGWAGVFLALAFYTYTAARLVFLIPILLIPVLLVAGRIKPEVVPAPDTKRLIKAAIVMGVTAVLLSAPLFFTLQQDPTLQERVSQLDGPLEALRRGDFGPIGASTFATLGVFNFRGDPLSSYVLPGRPIFGLFTGLLFLGGLSLALWRWRRPVYAYLLIWLAVALLPTAVTPDAPSMIRLIGAMPVVYLLPALAFTWLTDHFNAGTPRQKRWRSLLILGGALLIVGLSVDRTMQDGFGKWSTLEDTRLKYRSVLLDMSRHWRENGAPPLVVADSWYEPVKRDVFRRNLGFEPQARWVQRGQAVVFPPGAGDASVYIPEFAPLDPALLAAAGLEQPVYQSQNFPAFTQYALPDAPHITLLPEPAAFAGGLTLLGVEQQPLTSDNQLTLLSYWRVEQPLPPDLTIFVHILDAKGALVSQFDGLDVAPQTLLPGDAFLQRHTLPLPESPSAANHSLQIGLYTAHDGQRWTVVKDGADRFLLTSELKLVKP